MKCIVCGKETDWFEPRFGYGACEEHKNIPPVDIHNKPWPFPTSKSIAAWPFPMTRPNNESDNNDES